MAKFCVNCGAKLDDDSKFCPMCGTKVEDENKENLNSTQDEEEKTTNSVDLQVNSQQQIETTTKPKKKFGKKTILGIVVACVVAIAGIIFYFISTTSPVDLSQYIIVTYDGYNGYGLANVDIDWDSAREKYGNSIKFNDKASQDTFGIFSSQSNVFDVLEYSFNVEVEPSTELSNGDTVTVSWVDDETNVYLTRKLKEFTKTYTVEGLKEADTKDVFEDVSLTYNGAGDNLYIGIANTGEINDYSFSLDKNSDLKEGDEVTITLNVSDMNQFVEEYGYLPKETSKVYKIDKIPQYASSLDEITDKTKEDIEKYLVEEKEFNLGSDLTLNSCDVVGYGLLVLNDDTDTWHEKNIYVVIKKANLSSPKGTDDIYIAYRFYNVRDIDENVDELYESTTSNYLWSSDTAIGYSLMNAFKSIDDLEDYFKSNYGDEYNIDWSSVK